MVAKPLEDPVDKLRRERDELYQVTLRYVAQPFDRENVECAAELLRSMTPPDKQESGGQVDYITLENGYKSTDPESLVLALMEDELTFHTEAELVQAATMWLDLYKKSPAMALQTGDSMHGLFTQTLCKYICGETAVTLSEVHELLKIEHNMNNAK